MGLRAAQLAALIVLFIESGGSPAGAMGLCDCCGDAAALTRDCRAACAAAEEEIPMCRPAVVYDGNAGRSPGTNALGVESLKFLSMGHPDRAALERFRKWIELWRSRAEGKFQVALARSEGAGNDAGFASAEAERDRVVVNYQHGIRRYIEIVREGRPEGSEVAFATAVSAKAAVRVMPRATQPRRGAHRSQPAARPKVAEPSETQPKIVRVAVTTAKVCTGNWVNAACAVP